MTRRFGFQVGSLAAIGCLVALTQTSLVGQQGAAAGGQMPRQQPNVKKRAIVPPKWTPASRTPDGQPDLQGVWTNFDSTPMERANAGAGARTAGPSFNSEFDQTALEGPVSPTRPSLLIEPSDGHFKIKPQFETQRDFNRNHMTDSYLYNGPWERCITRGNPGIMFPSNYNNGYRILQVPGYVVIFHEMIHETRVIPVDGRPHISSQIGLWMGDSRGHWEGNTLVVETTNFNNKGWQTTTGSSGRIRGVPTTEHLNLVERWSRASPTLINWQVTVSDPTTLDASWTAALPLNWDPGYRILEYACHEGNDLADALQTGRDREKKAAAAEKK
jgi:hypothetical protein